MPASHPLLRVLPLAFSWASLLSGAELCHRAGLTDSCVCTGLACLLGPLGKDGKGLQGGGLWNGLGGKDCDFGAASLWKAYRW